MPKSAIVDIAIAVFLVVLVLGVYYPALEAQLVADDFVLVGKIDFNEASRFFRDTFGFARSEYRPVTALSYAVDWWLWRDHPAGYHLTNLLLHAVTVLLLFFSLRQITGDTALGFVAAALFAVHPVNHSRVAWISARDALVCAVFLLSSLWLYVRWHETKRPAIYVASGLLAACALLAYEGAVILPVLFLAVHFLFFACGSLANRLNLALRHTSLFWVLAGGYICLWQLIFSANLGAYQLAASPAGIAQNYGSLLYRLLYGQRRLAFGLTYLLVFALCHKAFLRQWRVTALASFLVFVAFVPYSVISGFADRFAYLSAAGFALLLSVGIVDTWRNGPMLRSRSVLALAGLLCVYYVVEVRKNLQDWHTAGTMAARIVDNVHRQYTSLPPGSVLVLRNIPRVHGRAMVFQTGLEAAIQRRYDTPISVQHYDEHSANLDSPLTHTLEYVPGAEDLRLISRPSTKSNP